MKLVKWYKNYGYLGWVSKASAIFGFKVQYLENLRWKMFQQSQHTTSDVLIVSFAGGSMRMDEFPRHEMVKTLSSLKCDQLFLADPTGCGWYLQGPDRKWDGFEWYQDRLREALRPYKHTIAIGSCMGASAALLMSNLFSRVICFNPQADPGKDLRWIIWLLAQRIPKNLRNNFSQMIHESVAKHYSSALGRGIDVHVSNDPAEWHQASMLPEELNVVYHMDCVGKLPRFLKSKNKLLPLISTEYEKLLNEIHAKETQETIFNCTK